MSFFAETEALLIGKEQYPEGKFYNRQTVKSVCKDSLASKKSNDGNCFVSFTQIEEICLGQIQYFIELDDSSSNQKVYPNVIFFSVVESISPIEGFIYRDCLTKIENPIRLQI